MKPAGNENKLQTRDTFIGCEFQLNDNNSSYDVEAFLRDRFAERFSLGNFRTERGDLQAHSLFKRRIQPYPSTPISTREVLNKALLILSLIEIEVRHDTTEEGEKKQDS